MNAREPVSLGWLLSALVIVLRILFAAAMRRGQGMIKHALGAGLVAGCAYVILFCIGGVLRELGVSVEFYIMLVCPFIALLIVLLWHMWRRAAGIGMTVVVSLVVIGGLHGVALMHLTDGGANARSGTGISAVSDPAKAPSSVASDAAPAVEE